MAHFTLQIENAGPLLNVQIGVSGPRMAALEQANRPIPPVFSARGLVDTGASCTAIDPSVVTDLELSPTGDMAAITPGTTPGTKPVDVSQYDVGVLIYGINNLNPLVIPVLPVIEVELANQGFQALIGRDILARCVLIYNGSLGQYTLSF